MDETRRRRFSIARELATWGSAMPALMTRISEALKIPTLPGRQKLEVMARRLNRAFMAIGETPDPDANDAILYEQLIENTDRLRELTAETNAALDRIVKR